MGEVTSPAGEGSIDMAEQCYRNYIDGRWVGPFGESCF